MGDGKRKKEVLYVWPYLEWGGAQIYFMGLMKLAKERYTVRALMPVGSGDRLLNYLEQLNVDFAFFDAHVDISPAPTLVGKLRRRWRKAITEIVIAWQLGWHRVQRSLLHVDFGPWSSFWLLLYLALRSQVFVTLHTALPHASWIRRQQWKLKFRVLCALGGFHLLASNRDMIESLKPFLPSRRIAEIPLAYSGVDLQEIERTIELDFDRAGVCEQFKLPPNGFFVFGMGQFIERKGCWVLLEAAQVLLQRYPDLCFVWIGTMPPNRETVLRIEEFGLGERFRLVTPIEIGQGRMAMLSLLHLADLFVLPSFNEGLPVALLEAMAMGKACIASNINAIPEAIRDHETGLLIQPGNGQALANAVAQMKEHAPERERLAAAGQDFVFRNFDERLTAQITVDMYDAFGS